MTVPGIRRPVPRLVVTRLTARLLGARGALRGALLWTLLWALLGATMLLAAPSPVAHAATEATPPVATASLPPGYQLASFRWSRTVVPVYYNWDGGTCIFAGNNFSSPATSIPPDVLLPMLQASIADINAALRGGLTLQLAGPATHDELCSSNSTKPIIVGFGAISSTGVTLSFGAGGPSGTLRPFSAARVFLTTQASFACASAPVYRDVQHTFTHELLHAIGLAHTDVAGAMMTPTFFACRSSNDLQPDDLAALAALYPPTQPAPTPTPMTSAALSAPGFSTRITYSTNGQALAVFAGGSLAQLESSAALAGARGVWVQDSSGTFRLLVVNGASFLRDAFAAAFPGGIPSNVAVTLVR